MKKRDKHQRQAYALRRMSLAVDRMILEKSLEAKKHEKLWVYAWSKAAGVDLAQLEVQGLQRLIE